MISHSCCCCIIGQSVLATTTKKKGVKDFLLYVATKVVSAELKLSGSEQ